MTIPKIIVQTSYYKPAKYIEENFKIITNGWEYYHFKDSEIFDFFEQNPLDEFPKPKEIFLSFPSGQHRADFFRYYFLYVKGGVYVDSDAKLEKNIDELAEKYEFFTVKSTLNDISCFNGFIGSMPKHHILRKALKNIYKMDRSKISTSSNYFDICNDLYTIVTEHKENCKIYSVEDKTKLLQEYPDTTGVAKTLYDDNSVILRHYVRRNSVVPSLKEIPDRKVKSPQETKIGVTFAIQKSIHSLFSNGINQNTLYFCELLHNIGYDLYIIINDSDMSGVNMNDLKHMLYDNKFKIAMQTDVVALDLDIFFTFGYSVHELSFTNKLKYIKTKRVAYFCGNSYIIDSERILYDQHKKREGSDFGFPNNIDETIYDEIWSIPQMANTNLNYWKTFYRCNCIEVPFIWSNKAIEFSKSMNGNKEITELLYKNRGKNKSLVIFEPNISIMKWCLPSVLICENAYRKEKNIEHLYINNVYKEMNESKINTFNLDAFNKILKPTDLYQNKKISIEKRYNTLHFMSKYADIAVSHQWENPLNYLYFDLAWMGWPVVHNAHLCKDVGYYYEGFNYEMGAKVLNNVINNHDNNIEEYIKKNRNILDRYLPSNKELQEKYKCLIENLLIK
jgi:hypothetical protein